MRFKIKFVDRLEQGFIGENYYHSKEAGILFSYSKNTILILKGMPAGRTRRTIMHEMIEIVLMMKGMKYHDAHIIANRLEVMRKSEVNKYLKKYGVKI